MFETIQEIIEDHKSAVQVFNSPAIISVIENISGAILSSLKSGGKILVCGNGGSAADAQHLAGEFVNRFNINRPPLPCIALSTDTSVITAIGNDFSYDEIFSKQIEALGRKGDVLIAISTSGASANVIKAVDRAKATSIITVGLLGRDGGALKNRCDIPLVVPLKSTPRIQECHILILHILSEIVENSMFGEGI